MDPVQISPSKKPDPGKTYITIHRKSAQELSPAEGCVGNQQCDRTLVMQLSQLQGSAHPRFPLRIPGIHSVLTSDDELNETVQTSTTSSILSSSRGPQDIGEIVDCLNARTSVNFLYRRRRNTPGRHEIAMEVEKRGLNIGILGIPKTIDNESVCIKTFGFETAFSKAVEAVQSSSFGSLRKQLWHRHHQADGKGFRFHCRFLASPDVNFVLSWVPFSMEGENDSLPWTSSKKLQEEVIRLSHRGRWGVSQELMGNTGKKNASGHPSRH